MAELRKKVIVRLEEGESAKSISERFMIARSTVYNIKKLYDATGGYSRRPSTRRKRSTRSEQLKKEVEESIKANPETSIRRLARDHRVAKITMTRLVKEDLGLKSLVPRRVQNLTETHIKGRVERGNKILNYLKNNRDHRVLIFSDEKDFHLEKYMNRRNSRYIAKSPDTVPPSVKYVGRAKFPKKAMMLGVVGADGKAFPPVWINGTLDGPMYKQILAYKILPMLDKTYGKGKYIWTQDGASCHTCKVVQSYLERRLGSRGFWSKSVWPANSPNLNPLDFSIWEHIEKRACATSHSNVESLKASVEREWATMSASYIRFTCSRFRSRLESILANNGGIIEK